MTKLRLILACMLLSVSLLAGGVGTTSEWGIVVTPCQWCGRTSDIEVHHIWPQHLWPQLAHYHSNMVCLCREDHLRVGHRGCFTNAVTNLLLIIKLAHE